MKELSKNIASALKSLRYERGWSLDKTAQETGVSKAMLGQIEREESSPTVATLWKIAGGFQVSFSSFLENSNTDVKKALHRTRESQTIMQTEDKIRILSLFPFDKQLHCEIFVIELSPGYEHLSQAHKSGVIEHVIVVSGKMEVLLKGHWQVLKKGEALRFDANQPHGYRNRTAKNCCFHNIIHYS